MLWIPCPSIFSRTLHKQVTLFSSIFDLPLSTDTLPSAFKYAKNQNSRKQFPILAVSIFPIFYLLLLPILPLPPHQYLLPRSPMTSQLLNTTDGTQFSSQGRSTVLTASPLAAGTPASGGPLTSLATTPVSFASSASYTQLHPWPLPVLFLVSPLAISTPIASKW